MDLPNVDVFAPRPSTSPGRGYYQGGDSIIPQSAQPGFASFTLKSSRQRSIAIQAAPTPWTRFFFPQQVGSEDNGASNPFFQHFDVHLNPENRMPLEEYPVSVPSWVPDAYHRLSFVHMADVPVQPLASSNDVTDGGAKLMRLGGEDHLSQVTRFCRTAARMRARSWRDAEPLTELLGGIVLYLLDQLQDASKLAAAKLQIDFDRRILEQKQKLDAEFDRRIQAERALLQAAHRDEALKIRDQVKLEVEEQFGTILKATRDNVSSLTFKGEKLQDTVDDLNKQLQAASEQLEASQAALAEEKAAREKMLKDAVEKEGGLLGDLHSLEAKIKHLQAMFLDNIRQQENEHIWRMATAAAGSLTLARASYCATLLTGSGEGDEMPVAVAPSAAGGAEGSHDQDRATLHFKYVAASQGQEFLVGQALPFGKGASWKLLEGVKEVAVEDVATEPSVHCFGDKNQGSYYAAPVCDAEGRVLGLIAIDTLAPAGGKLESISEEDRSYLRAIAEAVQQALAAQRDKCMQMALAGDAAATSASDDAEVDDDALLDEAREHADLDGGRAANKHAVAELTALTEPDLDELASVPDPGTVAWAVMKTAVSVLGVAAEDSEEDWSTLQPLVNMDLVAAAIDFDPESANSRWSLLRGKLSSVLAMREVDAQAEHPVVKAFHHWLLSVKKISAGVTVDRALQRRMERMKKAIQVAFVDSRSSALAELKSYRVPPKASFAVLRAVLLCLGRREEDCETWAAARTLVNHSLVTALLAAKPRKMSRKMQQAVTAALKGITEAEVKKESAAAFLLFKWVEVVLQMGSAQAGGAKRQA